MIEIIFLGTSSMVPTKNRNHSAVLIKYKGESILLDCGEGTQRQLKFANTPLSTVSKVIISHWHGDHVLGLPGLLQSMSATDYQGTLQIIGPKGTKNRIKLMLETFIFDKKLDFEVSEITKKTIYENQDYQINAFPLDHGVETWGFVFQEKDKRKVNKAKMKKLNIKEGPLIGKLVDGKSIKIGKKTIKPDDLTFVQKGKKIGFISDTGMCKGCLQIAKEADILICEATYHSELEEKSEEYKHLTAKNAALIASQSDSQKLILTHFSARYKDVHELLDEASTIFPNVIAAEDLMKIKI
jgi:ribonuclease Z